MLHRLIPWTHTDYVEMERVCAEAQAVTSEQVALAPHIDQMTGFLVEKAQINGFTRQLRTGFKRRNSGE
jgi:hypothetical protein